MSWTVTEDGRRYCARHNVAFGPLEACGGCATDPVAPPNALEQAPHDPQALADEQWCRDQRDAMVGYAKAMSLTVKGQKLKARLNFSTLAKLFETALKFHRAAVEERRRRGDVDHDRWLADQARKLAEQGASH